MNIAKMHLFVCRRLGAVAVVVINAAYYLGFVAIGNGVCIVLSGKGCCGACCGSRS